MDLAAAGLRALCRDYVTGTRVHTCPRPEDSPWFLTLARRHQLTPLLWSALGDRLLPGEALAVALKRDFYRSVARRERLLAMAGPLLDVLASERVPVIALKGVVLGPRYYADPADRPMRDVDLLVRREDVETVLRVAGDLGLRRYDDRHSLSFDLRFDSAVVLTPTPRDDSRPSIDLHWALFDDGLFARDRTARLADVWARAEAVDVAGRPVLTPGAEDTLLHLAAHLALHHAFGGLLWYCDLALLLRRSGNGLDWDALLRTAERLRLRGVLALVFRAVGELFQAEVPAEVRRWLSPMAPRWAIARHVVLARALRLEPVHRFEHVTPLLLMDRGRDCFRSLARSMIPGRDWVTLRYGAPSPRAYARHAANILTAVGRSVAPAG
jgi:hypothetical protein